MTLRPANTLVLAPLALFTLACSGDTTAPCSVGADCASGICLPDGTCAAPADTSPDADPDGVLFPDLGDAPESDAPDATDADATPGDTGPRPDSTPADTTVPPDTSTTCLPNRDDTITRAEVPIAPNLQATFLVAEGVTFDSRGAADADPRWDLAQSFEGDQKVLVETLDPATLWFADSFPTATYATRLEAGSDLLGVFEGKDDGLYLLGVASTEDGLFRTELVYDPPAKLVAYPLTLDATWSTTSTITGLTNGVVSFVTETYEGKVDAAGEVSTPFADFDVLRVVLSLDRWVGAALYFEVQHLFVSECFGTVASLRSEGYESGPEFDTAAELRRLSP